MEIKKFYNSEEVAEIVRIASKTNLSNYFFKRSSGSVEAQETARDLLSKLEEYDISIPENVKTAIGLDVKKLREDCNRYK